MLGFGAYVGDRRCPRVIRGVSIFTLLHVNRPAYRCGKRLNNTYVILYCIFLHLGGGLLHLARDVSALR